VAQGVPEADKPQPSAGLAPGTVVADRYRVESLLGEGGMGAVYRAEHIHMRKAVALKVLHSDANEYPEVVQRFEREAIAAANIAHPNVVSATDFGKLPDGSFFLVLEYVDGENLRDIIDRGKVPPERALHVIREIASALIVAHRSGVIHRDLKPENVMLVANEHGPEAVKVFDFGIAKIDVGSVTGRKGSTLQPITRVGTIFGTPDYMAPEQAMGQPVDGRADLYSLGVILFEMLSGGRPFKGGAVTLMRQHILQDVPVLPDDLAATLDSRIGKMLKKLLAKDPDNRYAEATQLVEALDEITGRIASVPPPGRSGSPPAMTADEAEAPTLTKTPADEAKTTTWRPAPQAGYSIGASKRRRRLLAATVIACVGIGAFGATIWQMSRSPKHTPHHEGHKNAQAAAIVSGAEPPMEPVPSATAAASASGVTLDLETAPADSAAKSDEPASTSSEMTTPPAAKARENSAPAPAKGGRTRNKPRRTGPGGVYIPPPKDWVK
jgi:serine/threonine protein kinase